MNETKSEVYISYKILRTVMEHTKRYFLEIPSEIRLPGYTGCLTEGERLALAYLNATLTIANTLGANTTHIKLILDDSKIEPI